MRGHLAQTEGNEKQLCRACRRRRGVLYFGHGIPSKSLPQTFLSPAPASTATRRRGGEGGGGVCTARPARPGQVCPRPASPRLGASVVHLSIRLVKVFPHSTPGNSRECDINSSTCQTCLINAPAPARSETRGKSAARGPLCQPLSSISSPGENNRDGVRG